MRARSLVAVLCVGLLIVAIPAVKRVSTQSAAAISSVSGALTHGATINVFGARFGNKPAAAPVKYDDFQNLATGQDLSANGWQTAGGFTHPKASALRLRPGTPFVRNALAEWSPSVGWAQGGDSSTFYLTGRAFKRGYLDAWFYTHVTSGTPGNQKPIRWHATSAGTPNLYLNIYQPPGTDSVCAGRDGTSRTDSDWCTSPPFYENWVHIQYLFDIGSGSNASDGALKVYLNSRPVLDHQNVAVWAGGSGGIPELYLGNYLRTDEGAGLQNSWESVYVDNTWARVEIGNNATYANCTQREIQIPIAWSDTGISVQLNRGSFPSLTNLYLFVVDDQGNASLGYHLTGGGPTPPARPTNLRIIP